MELRTCSQERPAANMAKVLVKGLEAAGGTGPAATPCILLSAMPMSKKRWG